MNPVDAYLADHLLLVLALWALVYTFDYALTIYGARLYQAGGRKHYEFPGSYELTPVFQKDVDALRIISPRFLFFLLVSCIAIALIWFLSVVVLEQVWVYSLLVGGLFLREGAVYIRHLRNIVLYGTASRLNVLQGRVSYPYWLVLRISAAELAGFAALFGLVYLLDRSAFFFGGGFSCAMLALQHELRARRSRKAANQQRPNDEPAS